MAVLEIRKALGGYDVDIINNDGKVMKSFFYEGSYNDLLWEYRDFDSIAYDYDEEWEED